MADQLTFALRDAGMELAAEAQEIRVPGWSRMALAAIESVARRQPRLHVDDVARYCEGWLEPPVSAGVWGAVWLQAIRRGYITRTGDVAPAGRSYRPHAHKHGRAYPIYASKLYVQEDAA